MLLPWRELLDCKFSLGVFLMSFFVPACCGDSLPSWLFKSSLWLLALRKCCTSMHGSPGQAMLVADRASLRPVQATLCQGRRHYARQHCTVCSASTLVLVVCIVATCAEQSAL